MRDAAVAALRELHARGLAMPLRLRCEEPVPHVVVLMWGGRVVSEITPNSVLLMWEADQVPYVNYGLHSGDYRLAAARVAEDIETIRRLNPKLLQRIRGA